MRKTSILDLVSPLLLPKERKSSFSPRVETMRSYNVTLYVSPVKEADMDVVEGILDPDGYLED